MVTDTIGGSAYQTLYGPGTDHPLARNGEFFLPNSLGSTALLTDSGGNSKQSYQYSPFGGLLNAPTDNNPFPLTGRRKGAHRFRSLMAGRLRRILTRHRRDMTAVPALAQATRGPERGGPQLPLGEGGRQGEQR